MTDRARRAIFVWLGIAIVAWLLVFAVLTRL